MKVYDDSSYHHSHVEVITVIGNSAVLQQAGLLDIASEKLLEKIFTVGQLLFCQPHATMVWISISFAKVLIFRSSCSLSNYFLYFVFFCTVSEFSDWLACGGSAKRV